MRRPDQMVCWETERDIIIIFVWRGRMAGVDEREEQVVCGIVAFRAGDSVEGGEGREEGPVRLLPSIHQIHTLQRKWPATQNLCATKDRAHTQLIKSTPPPTSLSAGTLRYPGNNNRNRYRNTLRS